MIITLVRYAKQLNDSSYFGCLGTHHILGQIYNKEAFTYDVSNILAIFDPLPLRQQNLTFIRQN